MKECLRRKQQALVGQYKGDREMNCNLFKQLEQIHSKPKPFEFYTTDKLWTDEHTSMKMLELHLAKDIDLASRNKAFIDRSLKWITEYFKIGAGTVIADFGCGPGLYANRFAEMGASVTGIDFSERSIQYARDFGSQ